MNPRVLGSYPRCMNYNFLKFHGILVGVVTRNLRVSEQLLLLKIGKCLELLILRTPTPIF